MSQRTAQLLPATEELLRQFGERLRLARLRRRLTAKQVAERAGMAPMTLRSLERGGAGVTLGAYAAVMQVLGIEMDFNLLGKQDQMGRELQDSRLTMRTKAFRQVRSSSATSAQMLAPTKPSDEKNWLAQSDFASAESLVGLIDLTESSQAKKS